MTDIVTSTRRDCDSSIGNNDNSETFVTGLENNIAEPNPSLQHSNITLLANDSPEVLPNQSPTYITVTTGPGYHRAQRGYRHSSTDTRALGIIGYGPEYAA